MNEWIGIASLVRARLHAEGKSSTFQSYCVKQLEVFHYHHQREWVNEQFGGEIKIVATPKLTHAGEYNLFDNRKHTYWDRFRFYLILLPSIPHSWLLGGRGARDFLTPLDCTIKIKEYITIF